MFRKNYKALTATGNLVSHFFLLIIRLYWGAMLIMIGLAKWMNIGHVADMFQSVHIPLPYFTAALVGLIEVVGGISLVFGLFARLMGLILSVVFIIAYATAHREALMQLFTNPELFFQQNPFLYLYASLIVFCFGPGGFSVDAVLAKKKS